MKLTVNLISGALKHLAYKLLGVVVVEYSLEQGVKSFTYSGRSTTKSES